MARKLVAGMYDSEREIDTVRRRLREMGISDARIRVHALPPRAGAVHDDASPGNDDLSHFIGRMFSGAVMDDEDRVAAHDPSPRPRTAVTVEVDDADEGAPLQSVQAMLGPMRSRVFSLPNSPSGWNEAPDGARASMRSVDDDPGQPEGLIGDAGGLPAASDAARLANRRRVR